MRERYSLFQNIKQGLEEATKTTQDTGQKKRPEQSGPSKTEHTQERQFIRIFKDEISKELWDSYCMGLGIENGDEIESFRVYINSQLDIQVDLTNEEKRV